VAGYIGSSRALSYTVIGDIANTSARLCSAAHAGQILVSEATLAQVSGRFQYKELEAVQLKGKRDSFRVFEIQRPPKVVAVTGVASSVAGAPSPSSLDSTDLDARN
jgi:adenylate cyclase